MGNCANIMRLDIYCFISIKKKLDKSREYLLIIYMEVVENFLYGTIKITF